MASLWVNEATQQAIQVAFSDRGLNVTALPAALRPGAALGESKLSCIFIQMVCVCVCHVMKFYHSTVDIPWGLVRTFCEEEPQVIDYNVAANPNQSWFLSHGNERFRFSWKWKTYRAPVLVGLRHDPCSHFKTASIQLVHVVVGNWTVCKVLVWN